ncbi:hypothetical protein CsSME_00008287 [Camellia sinensis var. sinensis]
MLSLDRPRQQQIYRHCHHRFFFFLQVCRRGVSDRQFPAAAESEGAGGGEAVIITGNFPIVSSNVRSAGASDAGSISGAPDDLHNSTSLVVGSCAAICYMAIWVGYTDVHFIFGVSKTLEHVQLSGES